MSGSGSGLVGHIRDNFERDVMAEADNQEVIIRLGGTDLPRLQAIARAAAESLSREGVPHVDISTSPVPPANEVLLLLEQGRKILETHERYSQQMRRLSWKFLGSIVLTVVCFIVFLGLLYRNLGDILPEGWNFLLL